MDYVLKKSRPELDPLFESPQREAMRLVKRIDGMSSARRSWVQALAQWFISTPDLNYAEYQRLESKRTLQQMRREGPF